MRVIGRPARAVQDFYGKAAMASPAKICVDELISALMARPSTFSCGEHTLDDTKTGMRFWISNGRLSGGIYSPFKMSFGIIQSLRFHRAVRAWKAWETSRRLRSMLPAPN